ncbi:Unknown protein, partial [Striga hermonthica]
WTYIHMLSLGPRIFVSSKLEFQAQAYHKKSQQPLKFLTIKHLTPSPPHFQTATYNSKNRSRNHSPQSRSLSHTPLTTFSIFELYFWALFKALLQQDTLFICFLKDQEIFSLALKVLPQHPLKPSTPFTPLFNRHFEPTRADRALP